MYICIQIDRFSQERDSHCYDYGSNRTVEIYLTHLIHFLIHSMTKMKPTNPYILHLSTHDYGGAGLAALNIYMLHKKHGYEVDLMVKTSRSNYPNIILARLSIYRNFIPGLLLRPFPSF